jgi:hypothetical protein
LVAHLIRHGAELIGEIVKYENSYRLCYIRAVEGVLVELAEDLSKKKLFTDRQRKITANMALCVIQQSLFNFR